MTVVKQCSTAQEALEVVKDYDGQMILLFDVGLEGLCPFSTTEKIMKFHPLNKVIFHTGYLSDALLARARHAGAAGYLLKSSPMSETLASIRKVAEGGTSFPQLPAGEYIKNQRGFSRS